MKPSELNALMAPMETISRNAGAILLKYFDKPMTIGFKGQFNMVTEADLASEKYIMEALEGLTPGVNILSEEDAEKSDSTVSPPDDLFWVVDPLDGTTNFAHHLPHFCVSIALVEHGQPVAGTIYDPCRNEIFQCMHQRGSRLNRSPIRVSTSETLERSLVATGFSYEVRSVRDNNLPEFSMFRLRAQGVRRIGAAALDLAYVAAGRLDGFWERWLKPWDTAAGILMVAESGGTVSTFDGSPFSIFVPEIVASNGSIHSEMLQILNQPFPAITDTFLQSSES